MTESYLVAHPIPVRYVTLARGHLISLHLCLKAGNIPSMVLHNGHVGLIEVNQEPVLKTKIRKIPTFQTRSTNQTCRTILFCFALFWAAACFAVLVLFEFLPVQPWPRKKNTRVLH
jgi:hypothetical protein